MSEVGSQYSVLAKKMTVSLCCGEQTIWGKRRKLGDQLKGYFNKLVRMGRNLNEGSISDQVLDLFLKVEPRELFDRLATDI